MDIPDFSVYLSILCAMLALLTLLYIKFGKISVEKMSPVVRDSRSVDPAQEMKQYVHDENELVGLMPRSVELVDIKPYSTYQYIRSDNALCEGGNEVLADGQCPGVVNDRVPIVFFKLPSVEPIVLGAGNVMQNMKITPEQSKMILDNVTKYVASQSGNTPDDGFVRDLYIDAFANVLADIEPGANRIETMVSIKTGTNRTTRTNKAAANKAAAVANKVAVKANKAKSDSGIISIRQKTLSENFEVAPSVDEATKMIQTATDVKKRLVFETSQYDNNAQPGDSCNDSTSVYENILNGCYSSRFPAAAGLETSNKQYSYADSVVNTTYPGDMCADGTIADENGCLGGIRPSGVSLETKRNFDVYTGQKQQYDFCPNNEFLSEIDTCKTVSEQEDFVRFEKDLQEGKKHLYDVLFPGPRKPFDRTDRYVANCAERTGICILDPSWM